MKTYRVSALASGFVRMWRGWSVILPVVIVNALAQAALILPDPTPGWNAAAIGLAVLSGLVFLLAYGLVAATALRVADGRIGWGTAMATLRTHLVRYVLWAVLLGLAIAIGLALYTVPGVIVLAVMPFLLLSTLDGRPNPVAANFGTLGRRFWRWLVTVVITGLAVFVGILLSGFFTFFVRGSLASFAVWLVAGLVLAWFTTAWALIYRSAAGAAGAEAPGPERPSEVAAAGGDLA